VGALEAVDTLTITRHLGRYAWGVDAAITPVFDTSAQDGMVRMWAARMDDGARRRLLQTWLKAGGLDTEGQVLHPVTGTPPGGTVSPLRAHVVRHDVVDLWVENVVKPHGRGDACLIRDADDCVGAVAVPAEAERFDHVLGQRRETCGLERAAAKTRRIPCRRDRAAGSTSVEVLGVECRGGKDRTGQDHLTRRTARTKLRTSRPRVTAWGKAPRHRRRPGLFQRLNATRRGYDKYSGVHGHAASLQECFNTARRMWLKGRNRRRPRHRDTGPGDTAGLERVPVARPRSGGRPQTRQATLKPSADLRTRVLLKRPVRANRTPGSVRGPSGNRRSYRDGPEDKSSTMAMV
jgi:RNA-directed DNA polymerase